MGNLEGLIPILVGIYGFLMAIGILPRNPTNPEKMKQWRKSYGTMMKVICPLIVIFGVLILTGVL